MSTVSNAVKIRAEPQGAFSQERTVRGAITLLRLHGTLDHAFEGRKTAESIKTKKVVVNLRGVRRFASWGMQEWMNFLRITAERDVYLIECSTYAASQLNLVTGLLGQAKLVSFYASYRCAKCSEEFETLFSIPSDRDGIRHLAERMYECETCRGQVQLEEYPAAFFDAIANRPPFEFDSEVLTYLRRELGYELPDDLNSFRAVRRSHKDHTYLRLLGSTTMMPSERLANVTAGTTVVDLRNVQFDPGRTEAWRGYLDAARHRVTSLQLMNCPAGFLEAFVTPADLHDKVSVRSVAISYHCTRCETQTTELIDVAEHLELLVGGVVPPQRCVCQALLVATPSQALGEVLRSLPARGQDQMLDKLVARAVVEPDDKLEDALARGAKAAVPRSRTSRTTYLIVTLFVLVLAALGVVGYKLYGQPPPQVIQNQVVAPQPVGPTFVRPSWIISDMPSSAYCRDLIDRMICAGVSSYQPTRDAAVVSANDAALDELVNAIGIAIKDPFFRSTVAPLYGPIRSKWLASLEGNERATEGISTVEGARHRVVQLLRVSGGPAVPAQRTDWYWEEYAKTGGGTETLVFVRYDISLEAARTLVENYAKPISALGSELVPAFPSLAWVDPHFAGGMMVTKIGEPLATVGLVVGDLVLKVDGREVPDGAAFTKALTNLDAPHELTVKTDDGQTKVIKLPAP